jgi:hypothetical protein
VGIGRISLDQKLHDQHRHHHVEHSATCHADVDIHVTEPDREHNDRIA